MELDQVEAFVRVAREGTFTRAAQRLHLTQPAISQRIAALEVELRGPLFERRGRQLVLTAAGEIFLPYAERMLALRLDSVQAVHNSHAGRSGTIKLAAPAPFVLSFLVPVLEDFRREYPAVDVLIRERDKRTILQMLHDHVMTLGLVNAPVFDSRLAQPLRFADPVRAVVAAGHPLAALPGPLPMESLYRHTIFRVSMFPEMTAFMDALVEHSRPGSGGAVLAVPMVMALRLVLAGQGLTFLPESYVLPHLQQGDLVGLTLVDMPRLVSHPVFIHRADRPPDALHQAFMRLFSARWQHLRDA
ncbi:MAG: LysR family transcriptional regulator [Anaerolineae bacterium]|jgi:DNA-binding transcriptional LysR family regulator|nr:LysR family transcriptional regulator [Anaerolineae bacterium]